MQRRKLIRLLGLSALALVLVGALALNIAGRVLKGQIESALGPESKVGSISLGLTAVTVSDLEIKAPPGWPSDDALRARRIDISPDWSALLSKRIAIRSIRVEGAYLSLLRDPQGHVRLLPSLLESKRKTESAPPPDVAIGEFVLVDAQLDFYDATLRKLPFLVRLEHVNAQVGNLNFPDLRGVSKVDISGEIKGPDRNGHYGLKGEVELATRNSVLQTHMQNVDLKALQPYLIKAADTGVRHGTLDLDLKTIVKQRHLHGQGQLTLHQLELDNSSSFMGFSRQAALGTLKDDKQKIEVQFELDGNLDDPKFSLNENMAMRIGAGLADSLGVSISGLGKGVGSAASGIGGAIRGLFGR